MYIRKVNIENIRSIEQLELKFDNPAGWHVLIGDNGSGKTSILRAISILLIENSIHSFNVNWYNWIRNNASTSRIDCLFSFSEIDALKLNLDIQDYELNYFFGLIRTKENHIDEISHYFGVKEVISDVDYRPEAIIPRLFSVAFGSFRRLIGGESSRVSAHSSIWGEEYSLQDALSWLKELDRRQLKKKESAINEEYGDAYIFSSVKNFINQSKLLPNNLYFDRIDIDGDVVFKDSNNTSVKITELSDGYRSILSMIFELIRQLIIVYGAKVVFANIGRDNLIDIPGIVLIDEVDAHLHPSWQIRIGEWFTRYFPKLQFIVTTHSPLICRAAEKGSIWRLTTPGSAEQSHEVIGVERERLINGNILDAFSTELFGKSAVRSAKTNELSKRLGHLNMLSALGQISEAEEEERIRLQLTLTTDAAD